METNESGSGILSVAVIFVTIIVVAGVGVHLYKIQRTKNNTSYFNTLSLRAQNYYNAGLSALGVVPNDNDLVKSCYRTEQGPFNKGRLWCGILASKGISIEPDQAKLQSLASAFKTMLTAQGFSTEVSGHQETYLTWGLGVSGHKDDGADPNVCSSSIDYNPSKADAAAKTTITYILTCANRSSELVPGFADNSHNLD